LRLFDFGVVHTSDEAWAELRRWQWKQLTTRVSDMSGFEYKVAIGQGHKAGSIRDGKWRGYTSH